MKICYVTAKSKEGVYRSLERSWQEQHNLVLFNTGIRDFSQFDAVCVFEPYECISETDDEEKSGPYVTIFPIWKQYLSETAPEVKLLVARFTDLRHPNVLPLLSIDKTYDWSKKVAAAKSNQNDWEKEVPPVGEPVQNKLQLFFKGHNNQGLVDIVAKVRQMLNHAYDEIQRKGDDEFASIWRQQIFPLQDTLRLLRYRWRNYRPYFQATPFWPEIAELDADAFFDQLIAACNGPADLSEEQAAKKAITFRTLNAYDRLDKIQTRLNFLNKKYITPEIEGRILLIDDDEEFRRQMVYSFPVFKFGQAADAGEGRGMLKNNTYNFVILDLKLSEDGPEDEGLDMLDWIKKQYPQLPVLVVSTNQKSDVQRRAIALGAEYFLGKSSFHINSWSSIFYKTLIKQEESSKERIFTQSSSGAKRLTILIIEDDEKWIYQIQSSLAEFQFIPATTATQAKDYLKADTIQYDLIMLDLVLQDTIGDPKESLDLLQYFRALASHIPVVMISNKSTHKAIGEALEAGAVDFLRKETFDIQIWRHRINMYVKLAQFEQSQTAHVDG